MWNKDNSMEPVVRQLRLQSLRWSNWNLSRLNLWPSVQRVHARIHFHNWSKSNECSFYSNWFNWYHQHLFSRQYSSLNIFIHIEPCLDWLSYRVVHFSCWIADGGVYSNDWGPMFSYRADSKYCCEPRYARLACPHKSVEPHLWVCWLHWYSFCWIWWRLQYMWA